MSEPSELEYAWSIAEARNERICQVLEDNLALRARVAKLEAALKSIRYDAEGGQCEADIIGIIDAALSETVET
jgi:hypothetical protein